MVFSVFQQEVLDSTDLVTASGLADMTLNPAYLIVTAPVGKTLTLQRLYLTVNNAAGGQLTLRWDANIWMSLPGNLGDHYVFDFYSYGFKSPNPNEDLKIQGAIMGSIVSYIVTYQSLDS